MSLNGPSKGDTPLHPTIRSTYTSTHFTRAHALRLKGSSWGHRWVARMTSQVFTSAVLPQRPRSPFVCINTLDIWPPEIAAYSAFWGSSRGNLKRTHWVGEGGGR